MGSSIGLRSPTFTIQMRSTPCARCICSQTRVPDDITLLLCDDNWGNIRKLPKTQRAKRAGGYGIYYHFDYVGGPRIIKWINTNNIPRVWEQMHLAHEYGVDRIWIVNVGDLKPMELPFRSSLIMRGFPHNIPPIARRSTRRNGRRNSLVKPMPVKLVTCFPNTPSITAAANTSCYRPIPIALSITRKQKSCAYDYNALVLLAEKLYKLLPAQYRDAFYQLVLFPIKASANLNELYVTTGKNHLYAKQGRASTNDLTARVKELYLADFTA